MSYFATLLTRTDASWTADDLDLDDVETFDELVDLVEEHADEADTAIVLVEHEGEWFGVVRSDLAAADVRVYVSDAQAAMRHALGEILLPDLVDHPDLDDLEPDVEADFDEDKAADDDLPLVGVAAVADDKDGYPDGPVGERSLLDDLGLSGDALDALAAPAGPSTTDAVAEIARRLDAAHALESVR